MSGASPLLGLGVVLQLVACVGVGARLLWLAARTRELPELCLGSAFVLLGGLGYPLAIAARAGWFGDDATAWLTAALAAQNGAALAVYLMNARVFHAGERPVELAVWTVAVGFVASMCGSWAVGLAEAVDQGPWYYLGFWLRAGAFLWAAADSTAYSLQLRRRLALGLADPVVVDRFRLWSIATIAISLGFAVFLAGRLVPDASPTSGWVLATTSGASAVSAVAMWLAFVPPRRYLERVRRGHG